MNGMQVEQAIRGDRRAVVPMGSTEKRREAIEGPWL
jgi:hypothetical protein